MGSLGAGWLSSRAADAGGIGVDEDAGFSEGEKSLNFFSLVVDEHDALVCVVSFGVRVGVGESCTSSASY